MPEIVTASVAGPVVIVGRYRTQPPRALQHTVFRWRLLAPETVVKVEPSLKKFRLAALAPVDEKA